MSKQEFLDLIGNLSMFVDDDEHFEYMMKNSWKLTDKEPAPPNYESKYGFGKIAFQSRQSHGDILGWGQEPSHLEQTTSPPQSTRSSGRLRDFSRSTEVQSEFSRPSISFKNASTIQSSLAWSDNARQKKTGTTSSAENIFPQGYHPDKNWRTSQPQISEPSVWNSRRRQQYASTCPYGRDVSPPPPPSKAVASIYLQSPGSGEKSKPQIQSLADLMGHN
jgi:hypothetical protein